MDKIRINEFLQFFKQIIIENKDLNFNNVHMTHTIYNYLIRLGVNEEDKKKNVEPYFNKWIEYYKNKENINVFVSPYWQYFCQFINGDFKNTNDFIKLYIPQDSNHLYQSATIIFDYLEKNNIKHLSKIGKEIRFDNIVIRLTNVDDAKKLIDFVTNNPYIQEGLIKPNPFTYNENNIAIASDGNLSYNKTIATYIRLFLAEMKNNNQLQNINADGFINFIYNYYQQKFLEKKDINNISSEFELQNSSEIIDLKNITELILNSYKGYSFDEFKSFFNNINDNNYYINQLNNLQNKQSNINELEIMKLLLEALKIISNKENKESAIERIKILLITGNYNYITRDNNLRYKLRDFDFASKLNNLLTEKGISINEYLNNIINKQDNNSKIELLLKECIEVMSSKYGIDATMENIAFFYQTNNPVFITRDHNLRKQISEINFKDEMNIILKEKGMTFLQYIRYLEEKYDLNKQKRR